MWIFPSQLTILPHPSAPTIQAPLHKAKTSPNASAVKRRDTCGRKFRTCVLSTICFQKLASSSVHWRLLFDVSHTDLTQEAEDIKKFKAELEQHKKKLAEIEDSLSVESTRVSTKSYPCDINLIPVLSCFIWCHALSWFTYCRNKRSDSLKSPKWYLGVSIPLGDRNGPGRRWLFCPKCMKEAPPQHFYESDPSTMWICYCLRDDVRLQFYKMFWDY